MLRQCTVSQNGEANCRHSFSYPIKLKQQTFKETNTPFSYSTKPKKTVDTSANFSQDSQQRTWQERDRWTGGMILISIKLRAGNEWAAWILRQTRIVRKITLISYHIQWLIKCPCETEISYLVERLPFYIWTHKADQRSKTAVKFTIFQFLSSLGSCSLEFDQAIYDVKAYLLVIQQVRMWSNQFPAYQFTNELRTYGLHISFFTSGWQSLPNALSVCIKNPLCVTIAISFSLRVHNLYQHHHKLERGKLWWQQDAGICIWNLDQQHFQ